MPTRPRRIYDISQPVSSNSACFPGDTPFKREVTLTYKDSGIVNLTAMTMSPHVGTHVDAPVHVHGELDGADGSVADLPLEKFIGEVAVVDLAPFVGPITLDLVEDRLPRSSGSVPSRLLIKTCHQIRYHVFEKDYSYFTPDFVDAVHDLGIELLGIDTPSVDHIDSKTLDAHHRLVRHSMVWLENLDLTAVEEGVYELVALPLKLTELEASPVRAVLLDRVD